MEYRQLKRIGVADRVAKKKLQDAKKLSSSPTREKARRLMARETMNAKKSRIYYFLVQELTKQYGTKRVDSAVNDYIVDAVNNYLVAHNNVDESSISELESKVKEDCIQIKMQMRQSKETAVQERRRDLEDAMNSLNMGDDAESDRRTNTASTNGLRGGSEDIDSKQWSVLNAIKAAEGEELEIKEKNDILAKKMKYRRELDEHNRLYRIYKEKQVNDERELFARQRKAEQNFNDREDANQTDRGAKVRAERDVRLEQIATKQQRLAIERQRKAEEEAQEIRRIKQLLEEDRQAQVNARLRQAKMNEDFKAENERFELIKQAQKRKEVEEEIRQQVLAKERAEKEEKRRADEFEALQERQRAFARKFDNEAGAAQRAAEEAEANLTSSLIERKQREDDERERLKQEKRRQYMEESKRINAQITARKHKEKLDEREYDMTLGQKFREDKANEDRERVTFKNKHREKTAAMRKMLDEQMQQKRQGIADEGALTRLEANLNRTLIEKMADANIAKRVQDRINPVTTYRSLGNNIIG